MTRRTTLELVGAPLLLAVGLGAGRFAAPARVETRVVTVDKVRLQAVVQASAVVTAAVDEHRNGAFTGKRTKKPDGTVTEEGTIVWADTTQTATREQLAFSASVQATRETTHEETKVVQNEAPRLTLGLGAGGSVGLSPLGIGGPTYAVMGNYRFAGPLSVWGVASFDSSRSAAGALVGVAVTF